MSYIHFAHHFEKERSSAWDLLRLREAIWQATGVEWGQDGTVTVTFKGAKKAEEACQLACCIGREFRLRQDAFSAGQAESEEVCHE